MTSNFPNATFPNGTGDPTIYLGPEIPIPVSYACGGITLVVMVINLLASSALCIARRSCVVVAIPCLKPNDSRRRAWLQHVVITALLLYCLTNLISAAFGVGSYPAVINFQMELYTILASIDNGFLFISAANSFVVIGMMILLWLNIAVVWFNMNANRTGLSRIGFIAVVGSLLLVIVIGALNSLIASFLSFLSPSVPSVSLMNNPVLSNVQFYITFVVSLVLLVYGVGIGIGIIVILKQGIKDDDESFMTTRRNVMIVKVLVVLIAAGVSLAIRFAGTLVLLNYFSLYAVLMLAMRAIPDAAIAWGFTFLFWPYKSAKVVTIDAPDKEVFVAKVQARKMQEMKPVSTSTSPTPVSEAPAHTETTCETPVQPAAEENV